MPLRLVDQAALVQIAFFVALNVKRPATGGDLLRRPRRIVTAMAALMPMSAMVKPSW